MDDDSAWEKCRLPLIPRRTVDGGWTVGFGQTWHRRVNGKWEYRQDQESYEDWLNRQI